LRVRWKASWQDVPEPAVDSRLARRRFERAAGSYAKASRLEAEIGARMLERLDYMKLAPRRVLDAGSGPGRDALALAKRYRASEVIALDFSLGMLRTGRSRFDFFRKRTPICADIAQIPFAAGAVELV
jgi:malonyl-CoA O-methyltransferase